MLFKHIGCCVGGTQNFDVKAFKQGAGSKIGRDQFFSDGIVKSVSISRGGLFFEVKDFTQFMDQPDPRGCTPKQIKVVTE